MLQKFLVDVSIDRRDFLLIFGLLFNVFTWLVFLRSLLDQIIISSLITDDLIIWISFYGSIIVFSIIGSVLPKRFSGLKFLYFWITLGAIASLLPVLVNNFSVIQLFVVSALFGASFGFGMPSCLTFFTEVTKTENRGRIGGLIFLFVFPFVPLLAIPFRELSWMVQSTICSVWRVIGLSIYFLKPKDRDSPEENKTSFISVIRDRPFLLFFIAWLLFTLVDRFEVAIIDHFLTISNPELFYMMEPIEIVVGTFSILVAGFMCDWIGRKKIILFGFVALGIAYAIIGFLPLSDLSWYLYFIVDGVAWGIFYLTFVLILWGDLSQSGSGEKYYALGGVPFFISYLVPQFLTDSFVEQISLTTAFSLASFFLFVAVMPLVFVPETLPEKKMELRRLRSFAEEARKAKEKYERKE